MFDQHQTRLDAKVNAMFVRNGLDSAKNLDGAVVEGLGRELMHYVRGAFDVKFEVYVNAGVAVVYRPDFLPSPLPENVTLAQIYEEIKAGVAVATGIEVEWKL